MDEFNSKLKPLRGQKNFYIFSSKSLSTDETLLCLKWLGKERDSTNSIVITANSDKANALGFPENSIVPFPETVGGRYSIWSPISLSAALENNFSPSTLVLDAPLVLEQGSDLKMWKPENYGKKFYGPSTLRMGLEKSRNLMTVRIAQELGTNKIVEFSKKLKIYENPNELLSISGA